VWVYAMKIHGTTQHDIRQIRILCNKEVYRWYMLLDIAKIEKSKRLWWARCVYDERHKKLYRVLMEKSSRKQLFVINKK